MTNLGEIRIIISQDDNDNLSYKIIDTANKETTCCYNGTETIKHIRECIVKIILKMEDKK